MKINIYYGGRGLLDDPTLYVISRIENVLKELRVKVERYNIYEHKNEIATLPQTFKDVDGIILATTVEWLGIGGYMYCLSFPYHRIASMHQGTAAYIHLYQATQPSLRE